MADTFSQQIGERSNQVRMITGDDKVQLIQAGGAVLSGVVEGYVTGKKNSLIENHLNQMSEEMERLSEGVKQGKIKPDEMYIKMATAQREFAANHPSLAQEARKRAQEVLGFVPSAGQAADVMDHVALEKKIVEQEALAAVSSGARVDNEDGTINFPATMYKFRSMHNAAGNMEDISKREKVTEQEFVFGAATLYNEGIGPVIAQMERVARETQGLDKERFGAVAGAFSHSRAQFMATLDYYLNKTKGLGSEARMRIRKDFESQFDAQQKFILGDGDFASMQVRLAEAAQLQKVTGAAFSEAYNWTLGAQKVFGEQYVQGVIGSNARLGTGIANHIYAEVGTDKTGYKLGPTLGQNAAVNNAMRIGNDGLDATAGSSIPEHYTSTRKKEVVGWLAGRIQNSITSKTPIDKYSREDVSSFSKGTVAYADAISNRGIASDLKKTVEVYNSPRTIEILSKAAQDETTKPEAFKAVSSLQNVNKRIAVQAKGVLNGVNQDREISDITGGNASGVRVQMNLRTGVFEAVPTKEQVIRKNESGRYNMNDALNSKATNERVNSVNKELTALNTAIKLEAKLRKSFDTRYASLNETQVMAAIVKEWDYETSPDSPKVDIPEELFTTKSQGEAKRIKLKYNVDTGTYDYME